MLESVCTRQDSRFFACPLKFAGDNGAQIAWTALLDYLATKKKVAIKDAHVTQSWRLDSVDARWR
jgi:N6-L-threonylcarbamoyladenine synthase